MQLRVDGQWGTVCGNGWTQKEADVTCYQLGYPGADRTGSTDEFGPANVNIIVENVICQVCPNFRIIDLF